MKVLIVGGAGYLGSLVCREFWQGHEPYLDRVHLAVYDSLLYRDFTEMCEFWRGDVTDGIRMALALKGPNRPDAVIWLACIVGDAACVVDPARSIAVNVDAVKRLCDLYDGLVIYPSSCSVYGIAEGMADEDAPMNPLSLYAESKIRAEEILKDRPSTTILRLGTLHGTSARMRFDLVVNAMTLRACTDREIEVFGGSQYRPLTAARDVAALMVDLALCGGKRGTYNVVGENLSVREVAEVVKARTVGATIRITDTLYEDKRNYRVSGLKAERELGFKPVYRVSDSVDDVRELVLSGRLRDLQSSDYSNQLALKGR